MTYGTLAIDTLNTSTGVLASQNGITGIAKAWVNFVGSSASINGSFNVSSVTRSSTGNYVVTYTTAMTNANYAGCGLILNSSFNSGNGARALIASAFSTTTASISITAGTGSAEDDTVCIAVFSS
jgi:hypothetical protein